MTRALRRAQLAVQALKEQQPRPLGLAAAHCALLISVHSEPGLTGAGVSKTVRV